MVDKFWQKRSELSIDQNGFTRCDCRCAFSVEIVALARNDVPDTPAWIGNVAPVAGNYMDMEMVDSLTGRGSGVEADIEPVWLMFCHDDVAHFVHQGHQIGALVQRRLPPVADLTTRHD